MNRLGKTLFAVASATLLAVTSLPAQAAKYQMVISMQLSDQNNPIYKAFEFIKTQIDARSHGQIEVKFFPGGALGGDRQLAEGVTLGDVQFTSMSTSPVVAFVPQLAIFDLPYVFPQDPAVLQKVLLHSDFSKSLDGYMEKKGMRFAGFFNSGFRELTTSDTPVHSVADIAKKTLRIRVQEDPYQIKLWKLLGAAPTPISYPELYGALQQGVVDGQENPYVNIQSSKLYEVQKYLTVSNHILLANINLMDAKWYNSLPDDLKKVVDDVIQEAVATQWKAQNAAVSVQKADLAKRMTVIELTPAEMDGFKKAAEPMVGVIRKAVGDDIVNSLLNSIKTASN
jgi:tripartite ATP-independent transporter DctP family solute receptor